MSIFITFEGGEGCGKSTQAKILYRRLDKLAVPVVLTYEPGGTTLGKKLGRWLKWADGIDITPVTELLLFNAARSQSVAEIIQPSLKEGKIVISDRYADSTTAYQGYGRGLDLKLVKEVNHTATYGQKPDLTVLMDIPPETGLTRKQGQGRKTDRFEQTELAFHQRVSAGFLTLAKKEPQRWLVVDATQPREKIAGIIWERVSALLAEKKEPS
jgi:dTMP kinase